MSKFKSQQKIDLKKQTYTASNGEIFYIVQGPVDLENKIKPLGAGNIDVYECRKKDGTSWYVGLNRKTQTLGVSAETIYQAMCLCRDRIK